MRNNYLLILILSALVSACSDGSSGGGDKAPEYSVDPTTIDVTQAEYCDITQGAHCLLPFPNDFFSVADTVTPTGRRINFDERAMPVNQNGIVYDPAEHNRGDGFSIGTAILLYVEGVDLEASGAASIIDMAASLNADAPIQLVHAETGERQLIWAEIDQVPAEGEAQALMIRLGRVLPHGERYIVVLQNLLDDDGSPIESSDAFKVYQEAIPSEVPELEVRREHMESLFSSLDEFGFERDELYLTWDFTTASTENNTARALHMRDRSLAELSGEPPTVTVSSVLDTSVAEDPDIGRVIEGTVTVPNFMDSADAAPGSRLNYASNDPDALPTQFNGDGTVEVPFICTISQAAIADAEDGDTDAQAVVLGHGVFGNRYIARDLGFGAQLTNAMFCSMDWWGMSDQDVGNAFLQLGELSLFSQMPDRLQQAFLNKIFLAEAIVNPTGFQGMPAFRNSDNSVLFRTGDVQYNGVSMGSVYGGSLTALSPHFDYSALDLAGMNWAFIIRRATLWSTYSIAYEPAYPDSLDQALGLSLVQMVWDRADSNGYANHITRDPLPGSKLSRVLIQSPIGDQILTETAAELMQRSLEVKRHNPSLVEGRHIAVEPYLDISPITTYPYEGNAVMHWDSGPFPINGHDGTPLQPIENLPAQAGYDTHGMPMGQPGAWEQKNTFWRTGQVINVCGAEPCYGDGYDGTPGVYDPANAPTE